ncbi:MAG: type II toxin-antitoxin system Phd/YefM family antitoxin [Nocardioides sp.]
MSVDAAREVTVRELRNHGGRVLDRVSRGETLMVTKDGSPVAELRPLPRRSLPAAELIARARRAPKVDPERLREDIDAVLDQSL